MHLVPCTMGKKQLSPVMTDHVICEKKVFAEEKES